MGTHSRRAPGLGERQRDEALVDSSDSRTGARGGPGPHPAGANGGGAHHVLARAGSAPHAPLWDAATLLSRAFALARKGKHVTPGGDWGRLLVPRWVHRSARTAPESSERRRRQRRPPCACRWSRRYVIVQRGCFARTTAGQATRSRPRAGASYLKLCRKLVTVRRTFEATYVHESTVGASVRLERPRR